MNSLHLEKRVPEKNQFRFYRLDLQPPQVSLHQLARSLPRGRLSNGWALVHGGR